MSRQLHSCTHLLAEPMAASPVQLPADGQPSPQFCRDLEQALLKATWEGVHGTAAAMPPELLARLVQSATAVTSKEPTLLEVSHHITKCCCCGATLHLLFAAMLSVLCDVACCVVPPHLPRQVQPSAQQQRVTVVGDTHGQFHDVCKL